MKIPTNVILSRTDGIGDMVLMLPMAAIIKKHFPNVKVAVLGKAYTKSLVNACVHVDEFIEDKAFLKNSFLIQGEKPACLIHVRTNKEIAKRTAALKIPIRIGTSSRVYHWITCTELVHLKRKKSTLHESQLNLKLLRPLGITQEYGVEELAGLMGLSKLEILSDSFYSLIDQTKYNLIIHPKSEGSSREWPIENFIALINMLDADKYNIFLSGVEKERNYIKKIEEAINRPVINLAGKMPLGQFLSFIKNCNGIIANATGPIHLGAALRVDTFGLYPPIKPIHPGRWAPLGPKVKVFVLDKDCTACKHNKNFCSCMNAIDPNWVFRSLEIAAGKTNPT